MSDLLPPNATPLERGVDAASARLDEIDVPVRHLWNPWKCPVAALPWLAWALGVETWNPEWPPRIRRQACAEAFEVHREKGTAAAIRRILDLVGAVYEYVEGPGGGLAPMHARVVVLNSESVALDDIAGLKAALDRAKRASVHLAVTLQSGFMSETRAAAGFGALQTIRFGSEGASA